MASSGSCWGGYPRDKTIWDKTIHETNPVKDSWPHLQRAVLSVMLLWWLRVMPSIRHGTRHGTATQRQPGQGSAIEASYCSPSYGYRHAKGPKVGSRGRRRRR
ncbi:hypothetical protein G6O67_005756 [Ophiocordyceps sinensis]|uniref:Uncharacterized protein n=1 Tax=Ophiocordyceps sinensis TaxID=72228 RepID=A0A8H4LY31_9HYPO|nr:hypothetical protein G6O67_005756 [Ophiocordyceps sinensis]